MAKTPLIKLTNFYIKREDLNPTGSAKDRAIPAQLLNLKKNGFKSAVISSTGNAAISASYFCSQEKIDLTVFVSPHINQAKLKLINRFPVTIKKSLQPISAAIKFSRQFNSYLLRQSTDPIALKAYSLIGREIIKDLPSITSLFVPVGSGTTLLGISKALPQVKLFAVQPASNPTITKYFDTDYKPEASSLTDALSVKYLPLKQEVLSAISQSWGSGLTIQNSFVKTNLDFLVSQKLSVSTESALVLAGFKKALDKKFAIGKYPVLLFTGTHR